MSKEQTKIETDIADALAGDYGMPPEALHGTVRDAMAALDITTATSANATMIAAEVHRRMLVDEVAQ